MPETMDIPSQATTEGCERRPPFALLRRARVDPGTVVEDPEDDRMHARGLVIAVPLALGLWVVLGLGVWWLFW